VKLKWSPHAQSDRDRIYDYLDADSPRAAILVDERIADAIAVLKKFPEIGRPGRIAGTRELVIHRTPYLAAYLIRETQSVSFVFFTARRSGQSACPIDNLPPPNI
jgi:toxin ParE1/3/4